MRINLTKKDLVNQIFLQVGFSKNVAEIIIEDFFNIIIKNIIKHKLVKLSKFGTFKIIKKKERLGRNPKTKEIKKIYSRYVITFKASKDFKKYINEN
tara:strand:+ start:1249 stop:1539 length:291 start_codon:yes stop_codon:yes gene_type:complete